MVSNSQYIVNTQQLRFARKFDMNTYSIELHFIGVSTPELIGFGNKRKERDEFFDKIAEKMNKGA